jgi:death-on-curing protein
VILYLSEGQVIRLHERQIHSFGGSMGLRDGGGLDAALARPQMTFGGEDLYPDLADKAAALLHSLVMNHPFLDGNKRVGAMAAEFFLGINGVELTAPDHELIELTLATARGEMSAEAIAIWFRQRTRHRDR